MITDFQDTDAGKIYRRYKPLITIVLSLGCVALFVGINMESRPIDWAAYKKWGLPSSDDIFQGDYWGLVTANFLHLEIWHIAFNLYWFLVLGKKIEFESKIGFYIFFILSAALISSLAQLGFSSSSGMGLSGVVYALFGYLMVKSRTADAYRGSIDNRTRNLFLIWLVVCVVLTETKILPIGNAAHFAGFAWGLTLALVSRFQWYKQLVIGCLLFGVIGTAFLWNPFATSWLSHKAFQLHKDQKIDEALLIYQEILERDSDNEFATINLKELKVYKLSENAFELHEKGQSREAKELYREILILDPNNEFARNNLEMLSSD